MVPLQCGQCPGRFAAGFLRCPHCHTLSPQFAVVRVPAAPAPRPARRARAKPKAA